MKFASYNMFLNDLRKYGLDYAAERAARLGFTGVELLDFCPLREKATYEMYTVEQYKRALERHGLSLACYSSAALLYIDDEEGMLSEIYRQADFAAALGSRLFHHTFTIGLDKTPDTLPFETVLDRIAPIAEKIAEHCSRLGMDVIYEPQGMYFNGSRGFDRLNNEMKGRAKNLGVCADVGNSFFRDELPENVLDKYAKEIKHVHVKDYIRSDEPLEHLPSDQISAGGKYLYDTEIGQGIVNFEKCFEIFKKAEYDGYYSIEFVADDEGALRMMKYMNELHRS